MTQEKDKRKISQVNPVAVLSMSSVSVSVSVSVIVRVSDSASISVSVSTWEVSGCLRNSLTVAVRS